MKMSNVFTFERKSLFDWLTVVNLHLLSTTVIHYISLVFRILSATGTGAVLQRIHSARAKTDKYAGHVFLLMFL